MAFRALCEVPSWEHADINYFRFHTNIQITSESSFKVVYSIIYECLSYFAFDLRGSRQISSYPHTTFRIKSNLELYSVFMQSFLQKEAKHKNGFSLVIPAICVFFFFCFSSVRWKAYQGSDMWARLIKCNPRPACPWHLEILSEQMQLPQAIRADRTQTRVLSIMARITFSNPFRGNRYVYAYLWTRPHELW